MSQNLCIDITSIVIFLIFNNKCCASTTTLSFVLSQKKQKVKTEHMTAMFRQTPWLSFVLVWWNTFELTQSSYVLHNDLLMMYVLLFNKAVIPTCPAIGGRYEGSDGQDCKCWLAQEWGDNYSQASCAFCRSCHKIFAACYSGTRSPNTNPRLILAPDP